MRLDKFLSECGLATRTETAIAAKAGEITVNGVVERRRDRHIDPEKDTVSLRGEPVYYTKFTYVMLNKPSGYISATEDGIFPVVTSLLPEKLQRMGLYPCGRLDKDTVGLMLLTNDGALTHRLLSPKHHAEKVYFFRCAEPLSEDDVLAMRAGMTLDGEILKSAELSPAPDRLSGTLTLTEGKYHQVKRMFLQRDNAVTFLERVAFGGISLDPILDRGDWRYLTVEEITRLHENK